jgi:trimethylamine--corrinoid protein Co-methyltransferase
MKISALNDSQIEQVRTATENLLENVGFRISHKTVVDKLRSAGANIDEKANLAKIPRQLLRDLLSTIPPVYTLKGIGGKDYEIGGNSQYLTAIVTDPWIMDYESGKPRHPSLADVRTNTIIAQTIPDVALVCLMDYPVTDFPDATSSFRALETHLLHHDKHYLLDAGSLDYLQRWEELADILLQGESLSKNRIITVLTSIVSPLCMENINLEMLLFATRNNLSIHPASCPMAGTTSPYSLMGTLIQANTEIILLAALSQLLNPGNPFNYTFGPSVSNMRTGHDLYYTLDKVLWKIAGNEMAKSYGMPSTAEAGGTLSHRYDMQSGAESMLFMLAAQNSGANILAGLGSCYNANGMSSEMMIIQAEWLKAAKFLTRGICTDFLEEGVASITEQGPGGNFLIDDLTMKRLRSDEFFTSSLFDTSGGYEPAPSMLENAHRRVEEMTSDFVSPVPKKIQEDLRRYFETRNVAFGSIKA